jgi:hypothetical protein
MPCYHGMVQPECVVRAHPKGGGGGCPVAAAQNLPKQKKTGFVDKISNVLSELAFS